MFTNIWNEKELIERLFNRISQQTAKPVVWVWIDDGSTDGSSDEVKRLSRSIEETEVWLEIQPMKKKGNLDTIGVAYNQTLPRLIDRINELNIDYAVIMDVDNDPCPNYCSRLMNLMNNAPEVGAATGIAIGEESKLKAGLPMGAGKFIRWSIMKTITKYWDIAPDTLLNIKALSKGYKLKTWPVPMNLDEPTTGFTSKGVFRQGRLNYYIGRPFWALFLRALRRFIIRQHGTQMLRGYLQERRRGTWRFNDSDTNRFYKTGTSPLDAIMEMISGK
ncbi:MAG: glycosyltransferase [Candidatus Thorarchaeota archaeon]